LLHDLHSFPTRRSSDLRRTIHRRKSVYISDDAQCHHQFYRWCLLHISFVKGESGMVNIKNLFKTYNQQPVIEDVSVSTEKGTLTSFIGPNGAGKSTLISMISRLTARDSAETTVDGQEILKKKNNELAKKISLLTQSSAMHLKLTVRELGSFGRSPSSQG